MTKRIWLSFSIAVVFAALFTSVTAQEAGSIVGTIKDKQNAVLPGAKVTLTNASIGVTRTAVSNDDGVFNFQTVPPGTYTVNVALSGFKKLEKSGIVLNVSGKISAGDFVLDVGDVAATVEVSADTGQAMIQSESGERSDIVSTTQLQNIGLNGRNATDLVKLIPGVLSSGFSGGATSLAVVSQFNINGTRADQHEVTVDGVTNYNLGNNTAELVTVNPDAVGEVRVLTSNYSAEFGRSGGGFISITTRGGTNEYHGSGRYYRRHDSMNANNYFSNNRGASAIPRPLYRYNFYGWDFGGPVAFPKFGEGDGPGFWSGKKKLFFFINQEYDRQLVPQAAAVNIRVPTAAERNGDFSQSVDGNGNRIFIRDPLSSVAGACTAALQATNSAPCFANAVIPANRLYAPGLASLRLIPLPNSTSQTAFNYTSQVPSAYPRSETILRVDWQANDSTRVSARWTHNKDEQQFSYGTTTASWNWPLTTTNRRNGPGNIYSFSVIKNFGSTWINEFIFAAARGGVTIAPSDDKATQGTTGIVTPLLYPSANTTGLIPSLNFGTAPTGSSAFANTSVFGPFVQNFVINNFIDNVTKVWGNHTLKTGVYFQRASNISNSQNHVQSDINFGGGDANNPLSTGYGFANAALGVYSSYTQASVKLKQDNFYQDISFYVQDSWKITPRLTAELGIRLSHFGTYVNNFGPEGYFDPTLFKASDSMRLYRPVCVGASTCTSAQIGANIYRGIDPLTVGTPTLANTVSGFNVGKLIPGVGSFTNGLGLTTAGYPRGSIMRNFLLPQPRLSFAWDVTGKHTTVIRGGAGIAYDRYRTDVTGNAAQSQPFVLNPVLNNGFLQDIQPATANTLLAPGTVRGVDRNGDFPSIYSYSIGIQRQLWGTVLDVAYVGTQSRHNVRTTNINTPALGAAFKASSQDPTKYAGGVIPATEAALPAAYSAAGLSFTGANAYNGDFLRPYQGYTDILYINFDGNATYNSLQISAQRRLAKDISLGMAYTLSKTTTRANDNTTVTSPISSEGYDRQLANFDRKHFFSANFVWTMPKASKWLGNNAVARAALDNWTLSGTTFIATGTPAELGFTIAGIGDAGIRYLGTSSTNSGITPRLYVNGVAQTAPNQINVSAFVVPNIGDKGPYPRTYLRNPGFWNQDLALAKKFPFGKEGRHYIQLRAEAFNAFNHTEFSGVNRTLNFTNAAGATGAAIFNNYTGVSIINPNQVRATSSNPNAPLGTYFGEYNGTRDPRILQLAVRLYF